MTTLPQDIKERFYKTIEGDISPADFEQWLYADKELANHLEPDDYLELVSFGFKKSGARYELGALLRKHINAEEYETYKMLELLYEARLKNKRLPYILMDLYDLYCKGYDFLKDLGLGIGLAIEVPTGKYASAETWDELTPRQQKELIESFSPELEECIEQLIHWLEAKEIVLTGEQNHIGHYIYRDQRTEEEKKSRFWVAITGDESADLPRRKNILWDRLV